MKRGILGCDLKHQVTVIGVTYCALCILGIIFGSLLLDRPESFADQKLRKNADIDIAEKRQIDILTSMTTDNINTTLSGENDEMYSSDEEDIAESLMEYSDIVDDIDGSEDDDIAESLLEYSEENFDSFENVTIKESNDNQNGTLKEDNDVEERMEEIEPSAESKNYKRIIRYIKNEGIEAIIGSFLKLFCSILLIKGARLGKPWLLVPWLVEETIEMVGGFIHFTIQAVGNNEWSLGGLLMGVLFYLLGCYFLYTVASFHNLLRRMNKNSSMIVASVSQGVTGGFQSGLNYQRLEEECWQSEPNLATEFGSAGFVREKKVDLEEDGDEHVLYVQ